MIWENIALAFASIKANKMRSLLTMLGIIIGIMSIIAIMTIGDAMTASVSGSLSSLGGGNITLSVQEKGAEVNMFSAARGGGASRSGKTPASGDLISDRMIEDMSANFHGQIDGVSISHSSGSAQAKDGDLYANISVYGVNPGFITANNIALLNGAFISESDVSAKSQAAVVSDRFVRNMFPGGEDPIGRQVKVYNPDNIKIFTIIGVYRHEQTGFMGTVSERDISTAFYIPVSTAKQDILEKNYSSVTVTGSVESDINALTERLQRYFNVVYANNADWQVSVSNMTSMLDTISETMNTMSVAIAFIAGISLLVGGIGVMNIMLVSVTERTKEIGTRKALGAKNRHIQLQFVTEAVIISLTGGVVGLLLGILTGAAATGVFGVPLVISPVTTAGSVLFSMAVGVFFGIYPANKAAGLDPIDALRYE